MTSADERELDALRARVYGPTSASQPDEDAVRRLHELEEARRPTVPQRAEVVERAPVVEIAPPPPDRPHRVEAALRWTLQQLEGVPRRVVLITLGVAALITVIAVALTLVPRLHSEPLQAATEEIERLAPDPGFVIPRMFSAGPSGDEGIEAFESFHGVRSIVGTGGGMFGDGSDEDCLNIFIEADITDPESDSFSGMIMGGCAAGGFPAMAQFVADREGWPQELREAFPDSGLRFVYDPERSEVVVYETKL